MNSEFCRLALAKVGNPPLIAETGGLGAADIALLEIIEEKMGWIMPEELQLLEPVPKKRKKH